MKRTKDEEIRRLKKKAKYLEQRLVQAENDLDTAYTCIGMLNKSIECLSCKMEEIEDTLTETAVLGDTVDAICHNDIVNILQILSKINKEEVDKIYKKEYYEEDKNFDCEDPYEEKWIKSACERNCSKKENKNTKSSDKSRTSGKTKKEVKKNEK